jgi:predicted amidohydrolase
MFSRIGFFHFAEGYDKPIPALKAEIAKHDVGNSLIVLPEAFNLGRPYNQPGEPRFNRDKMLADLGELSRLNNLAFVVGLLEPRPPNGDKPLSSSYFVDQNKPRLMCHKAADDTKGHYTMCSVAPDHENPIVLDDTTIVSVVCMDVDPAARCGKLAQCAKAHNKALNLICIPAAMQAQTFFGGAPIGHQTSFGHPPDAYPARMILANAYPDSISSFITDTNLKISVYIPTNQRHRNQIVLVPAA